MKKTVRESLRSTCRIGRTKYRVVGRWVAEQPVHGSRNLDAPILVSLAVQPHERREVDLSAPLANVERIGLVELGGVAHALTLA